ncbi:hypothetical protein C5167_043767 [Papaver somniferum]|uniref:Uncharacterized protein n=1 Tax=Papaver somniferum TaxID=3469 RepID=A0A4Y7L6P1_PAPSO|nr:hypothetical protein C5167_043767 [Papaver somniferum]
MNAHGFLDDTINLKKSALHGQYTIRIYPLNVRAFSNWFRGKFWDGFVFQGNSYNVFSCGKGTRIVAKVMFEHFTFESY